jgi:hypothetical protein
MLWHTISAVDMSVLNMLIRQMLYHDYDLLGHDALQSTEEVPMFQRNLLLSSPR